MAGPVIVDLPERLTIATAESLHEQLEPLLNGGQDVVLNGAEVTRADTAGLQTLYAFSCALSNHGISLSWSSPSSSIVDAAELLGLRQLLALP